MVLNHRKLLFPYLPKEPFTSPLSCCKQVREKIKICLCPKNLDLSPPPPPPLFLPYSHTDDLDDVGEKRKDVIIIIVILLCVIAGGLLFQCLFILVHCAMKRSRENAAAVSDDTREQRDFFDEDHESEIDHPVWYINAVGLQRSVIDSIAVFRFKKDEGMVDGTECSVCLNEFQEDESLRLLPKCNHAFHINCIDTWLRSHKNCPLCRAAVVSNKIEGQTRETAPNPNNLGSSRETRTENRENSTGEAIGNYRDEGSTSELRVEEHQDSILPCNARNPNLPSRASSDLANNRVRNVEPMRRSFSIGSSLHKGYHNTKRSFFCGVKLSLSRSARVQDAIFPSQPSDPANPRLWAPDTETRNPETDA